ncbi:hypothetical protein E2C01_092362 [Portunus trituberculatus]|uniref:Uncharacterized protein n=1 Tax=Portunus trituberculatus TaxID=210409 RepID=A0A5B7JLL8_PORTR|nr:hypothetical protein [Portunus trituberculatus]
MDHGMLGPTPHTQHPPSSLSLPDITHLSEPSPNTQPLVSLPLSPLVLPTCTCAIFPASHPPLLSSNTSPLPSPLTAAAAGASAAGEMHDSHLRNTTRSQTTQVAGLAWG